MWDDPNARVKVPNLHAHQIPQKVLVDFDSRTVAMEVGIR